MKIVPAVRSLTREVLQAKGYIVVESDGKINWKSLSATGYYYSWFCLSGKNEMVQSFAIRKELENVLFNLSMGYKGMRFLRLKSW